jgi:outer membrane immunogenic protein
VLLYGTIGLAYGALRGQNTFLGTSQTSTEIGWVAGAGVEMALTRNWSSKIEYLYVDLGERPYWITGTNNGLETNLVRFGVNYRF